MIKRLITKLIDSSSAALGRSRKPRFGKRVEVPVSEHGIDPTLLDERAVRVVQTLTDAGYEAYIVGGAVRDLLLGWRPKDFDVATNATPEQVKGLFRRAFIIGRRFRIVHVIHGRGRDHEVVEVSTFRAYLDTAAAEQVAGNERTAKKEIENKSHVVDAEGRVLRDNVWGPQIEDAARRDFTINAMYYDPRSQVVVDYHHGYKNVRGQVLRMIGDPATRYREDPVRILRVVRFAAKLGFKIEPKTHKAIAPAIPLLSNVPISRMFDEMIKLLQTGHALASLEQIRAHGLDKGVFPILDAVYASATPGSAREKFVHLALSDTDRRVGEGQAVAPSFMLACMLWHDVLAGWEQSKAAGEHVTPALQQAIDAVFDARIGDISGRGKLAADMREIWMMQPRFERRTPSAAFGLVEQPRFRAGFDFLRLRADVGEASAELAEWWEDFSLGDEGEREALLESAREAQHKTKRVARAPRVAEDGSAPRAAPAAEVEAEDGDEAPRDTAPRKRRRRRRKPSGGGAGGAPAAEGALRRARPTSAWEATWARPARPCGPPGRG